MIVRRASDADLPQLVELGAKFLGVSPFGRFLAATADELGVAVLQLLQNPKAVILVAADDGGRVGGMLIGLVTGSWFKPGAQIAAELVWWVEPEHRGSPAAVRLVREFEDWGRTHGARVGVLSDIVLEESRQAGELIARLGYQVVERAHLKEL